MAYNFHQHGLAGIIVVFELVVYLVDERIDPRNCRKLDASENGALESFREDIIDLGGISELGRARTLVSMLPGRRRKKPDQAYLALERIKETQPRVTGYSTDEAFLQECEYN